MRFDQKSGEVIEWAPSSICNFEPVSATAAASAAAGTAGAGAATAAAASTTLGLTATQWAFVGAAASVVGLGVAMAGGAQAQQAAEMEAAQLREEADNARVAAMQDEAQRRRELASVLGTQDAIRAGRGVDLYSPTGMNIREVTVDQAQDDIETSRLNYLNKQRRYLLGAGQAEAEGTGRMISAVGSAASSAGSAATAFSRIK